MLDQEHFRQLLKGHLEASLSQEEEALFMAVIRSGRYHDLLGENILAQLRDTAQITLPAHTQQQIIGHILAADTNIVPIDRNKRRYWMVAAAAMIIVIASALFLYHGAHHTPATNQEALAVNTGNKTLPVSLPDGSTVELQPGARLYYPQHFSGSSRTVRLEGNAFFKIAPDARQPFYAYSQGIITHVLGTSFQISSDNKNELKVVVRTGKVEIHRENEADLSAQLTPNQQIVYKGNDKAYPALVDTPLVLTGNPDDHEFAAGGSFRFRAATLESIFTQMQKLYGIDVLITDPALSKSLFTGDLSHETLYTALKIICLSVNGGYEVKGTKIYINKR